MEQCYGCGIAARDGHPMVAVGKWEDGVAIGGEISEEGFSAAPICAACHADPAHRTLHPVIKGTFFYRKDMGPAVRLAGSSSIRT